MIAAIATIAFLAAALAAIIAIADSLEVNFGRVGAALRGATPPLAAAPVAGRISQRYPAVRSRRVGARPSMLVAA